MEDLARKQADEAMDLYARTGDHAAFGTLFNLLSPRLLSFLHRGTRNEELAEDLMQKTFLRIHRARGSFKPGARVIPWAWSIARRLMIDAFREGKHATVCDLDAPEAVAGDPSAEDVVQARQLAARVLKALERLPENQREAYEMIRYDELSVADVAEALGITETAVKLRAHRAYEALRAEIGPDLDRNTKRKS